MRIFYFCFSLLFSVIGFPNQMPKLSDYKWNAFSQFGEGGIIDKIFEIIGTTSKVAIEFGAADGFDCSNTANLWTKDPTWTGILIEAESALFSTLVSNIKPYHCIPISQKVGIAENDSLESILKRMDLPFSSDYSGNYKVIGSGKQLSPKGESF